MTEKQDSEKIQAIIAAARKRFAHYGLAKTTMNEIAADIGMSKASLYYYFPDKEHLFIGVIRLEMENFFHEIGNIAAKTVAADKQLTQYVDLRFRCFKDFINLGKLASTHFETVRSEFTVLNDEFVEREKKIVHAILATGIKSKTFADTDPAPLADLFVSVLRGLRILVIKKRNDFMLTDEDYESLKNYQTQFTAVFIKGISRK